MNQTMKKANLDDRTAGAALAIASVLVVAVMAHHPSNFESEMGAPVHAVMIVLVIVSWAGYARLAWRCGVHRFSVLFGLAAYTAASLANILAGTIDGFITPALLDRSVSKDVLRMCWEINQAMAFGAVYATAAAITIWSIQLLRVGGVERAIGILGIGIGAATAVLLLSGTLSMQVAGALIVYALEALFGLLAAVVLLRARL